MFTGSKIMILVPGGADRVREKIEFFTKDSFVGRNAWIWKIRAKMSECELDLR